MKNPNITLTTEITHALNLNKPVVALESTVITHGLPRPQNLQLARDMEKAVSDEGATPATIAVLDGKIRVGLSDVELIRLAESDSAMKISHRDFATAIIKQMDGGTTVAGTLFAAHQVGIQVFATGGIGGVHRESAFDISNDLPALAETPIIVVCAGAKAILDLPSTLEYLETAGVPVIGYQTDEFPAFYSRRSGLKVSARFDSPKEIAGFAQAHWKLGMRSAVLVTNPIPVADNIPMTEMLPMIEQASNEAMEKGISGQALTPFLLSRISELTGERSLRANLSLLLNNAKLAAQITCEIAASKKTRIL